MITPEIKDQILRFICDECEFEETSRFETKEFFDIASVSLNELDAFISQLKRMKLLGSNSEVYEDQTNVQLYLEAQDFLRIGGFTAREAILIQNIEKLDLEMQKLRENPSDTLATAANIASILTNILSFFGPV